MTSHAKSIVANAGPDGGQSDVRQAHRACSDVGCGGPPNHRQDALAMGGMGARVMMELDDDPERDDKREVDTIKWLYEVLRDEAHNVRGYLTVNRHAKGTLYRRPKRTPSLRSVSVDGCFFVRLKRSVSSSRPDDRRAPRAAAVKDGRRPSPEAARSVLDGGEHDARLGQDGSDQARFLKRQLSLPVSMMSQWCVRRSRSAVVILASPKTLGHSPNARFVVMITEACS
jgi:hypothetical protein